MSDTPAGTHRIGLISDTHGLVRADVHVALRGVELILHAGDVGGQPILDALGALAPVRAVAGNTDAGSALGRGLPESLSIPGVPFAARERNRSGPCASASTA